MQLLHDTYTTPLFLRTTPNTGHYASPNPILSHKAHLDPCLFRHVSVDDVLICCLSAISVVFLFHVLLARCTTLHISIVKHNIMQQLDRPLHRAVDTDTSLSACV